MYGNFILTLLGGGGGTSVYVYEHSVRGDISEDM